MLIRAILAFLALPALFAGLFPWFISLLPAPAITRLWFGAVLILPGGIILISSAVSFYRRGRGTLAPWDPPKHLVVQDIYRFNRNPMYVGVCMLAIGWALCTGNPWNYAYGILLPVIFHLRVIFYEEKEMERLFGSEWKEYSRAVPRWGLRFRPFSYEKLRD